MKTCEKVASDLDVTHLVQFLNYHEDMWSEITIRQEFPGTAHADTHCIFARGPEMFSVDKFFMDIGSYDYPAMAKLAPHLNDLLTNLLSHTLEITELGRILIVNLKAGGRVEDHIDEGDYADYYNRFHIVLTTNDKCTNTTGGEAVHWGVGECWWFNHKLVHSAENYGETSRIHIIVDAVSPLYEKELPFK